MVSQLVECVPNISEGRDQKKIEQIVQAVRNVPGCTVLGVEPDHDYHRTVITFAGAPADVAAGAIALIGASIELLDMQNHKGEHPRLGVVDVCPFVPLQNITMEECAELARTVVKEVAQQHDVPLFLYGAAAATKERTMLSDLRKGEYENLHARLDGGKTSHSEATRFPDAGTQEWSPLVARSGGITIGARSILVAYNVNVNEQGASVAKKIGSIVRSSGRLLKSEHGGKIRSKGMLPKVQGMGVPVDELGISQVSMNLLDVSLCPLHLAFKTCESLAGDHGVELCGSEIVGLVPLSAMREAGRFFNPKATTDEELVETAIESLGLNEHHQFIPKQHIIEWALSREVME
ncbi:MAG: glutamate formimidoyltransferase [Candidatus Poseidonia sp.]|nr:glutamate formimidoyltransferase [Poseidonia sp.]MCH1616913.1 glutamate formimidoyltransferase [Poseidonia sp.]